MKKQCACEFCDKVFEDFFKSNGQCVEAIQECFKHEVLHHLNGEEVCRKYIENSLDKLNKEYGVKGTYSEYSFNPYYRENMYDEDKVEVTFYVNINEEKYFVSKEFIYRDRKMYLEEKEFYDKMLSFYIKFMKEYIGVVREDPWCGGCGTVSYLLNENSVDDLMKGLVGKKISIKIIE